ncbi:50S ribosomal protein L24e [Haladaptatus sp. DYSN1]|uniref:50S ribosomal protein L24e n=1 Tax=unclassified Haladaptatus TaxID=2622732 RepID=UPI002405E6A1|nr:50S ribosomal protein L24e [Haladaptatus sp. DYSN1]
MVRTRDCDYCGDDIEPGTGTMFVFTDGRTVNYCSSKCEKNAELGRESRNLRWTEEGRRVGGANKRAAEKADAEAAAAAEAAAEEEEAENADAAPDLESAEAEDDEETEE